ncbi:MAG: molybdenum cofactor guanylyltransferase [Acidobacteriota bacterium]
MRADVTIAPVDAYVLAGGDSRRMGSPKTELLFGGKTFLERVVSVASQSFKSVFVVVRSGQAIDLPANCKRLEEPPHPERSPMFGILTALRHSQDAAVWILAADYPLLTSQLLDFLRAQFLTSDSDLLVPVTDGKTHMLCAGYSRSLLEPIDVRISRGEFRLRELVPAHRTRIVSEEEIARQSPLHALWNINSAQDYARIGGLLDTRNQLDASQP